MLVVFANSKIGGLSGEIGSPSFSGSGVLIHCLSKKEYERP